MSDEKILSEVNKALDKLAAYVREGGKALVITWDGTRGAGSTTYNMSAAEARAAARETSLAREAIFQKQLIMNIREKPDQG
jgi:hypothetical protein